MWADSHAHLFTYCSKLFAWCNGSLAVALTRRPTKLRIFTVWTFIEKVCWPLIWNIASCCNSKRGSLEGFAPSINSQHGCDMSVPLAARCVTLASFHSHSWNERRESHPCQQTVAWCSPVSTFTHVLLVFTCSSSQQLIRDERLFFVTSQMSKIGKQSIVVFLR